MNFPFKRTDAIITDGDHAGRVVKVKGRALQGFGFTRDDDMWSVYTLPECKVFAIEGDSLHPHPEAPATNIEFLSHAMEYAQTGVIFQAFVLEAMRIYAEQVLAMSDADRAKMDETMLPYAPWQAAAKEALEALAARK